MDWDRFHLSCGAVPWAEEWGQGRDSGKFRNSGGPAPATAEPDGKHRTPGPAAGGGGASPP